MILVGFRSIWPAVKNLSGRTAYAPGGMTAGVYIEDGQVFYKLLRTPLQLRSGVFYVVEITQPRRILSDNVVSDARAEAILAQIDI